MPTLRAAWLELQKVKRTRLRPRAAQHSAFRPYRTAGPGVERAHFHPYQHRSLSLKGFVLFLRLCPLFLAVCGTCDSSNKQLPFTTLHEPPGRGAASPTRAAVTVTMQPSRTPRHSVVMRVCVILLIQVRSSNTHTHARTHRRHALTCE